MVIGQRDGDLVIAFELVLVAPEGLHAAVAIGFGLFDDGGLEHDGVLAEDLVGVLVEGVLGLVVVGDDWLPGAVDVLEALDRVAVVELLLLALAVGGHEEVHLVGFFFLAVLGEVGVALVGEEGAACALAPVGAFEVVCVDGVPPTALEQLEGDLGDDGVALGDCSHDIVLEDGGFPVRALGAVGAVVLEGHAFEGLAGEVLFGCLQDGGQLDPRVATLLLHDGVLGEHLLGLG